jgi:hydroxyethylthiazole kinase-like uncharacterized protein yjeF
MENLWFTADRVRQVDRLAVERYAIPSIVLMENAAIALREASLELVASCRLASTIILAGPGNNGGDGFALARHLDNHAIPVHILCTHPIESCRGDARTNFDIIANMGLPCTVAESEQDYDKLLASLPGPRLIVDALLGTGVSRPVSGIIKAIIDRVNARDKDQVLSVDIPSGMDADLGPVHGPCVRADLTVSFVGQKIGMAAPGAAKLVAEVVIGDIGVPRQLAESLATAPPC